MEGLERKFTHFGEGLRVDSDAMIEGYASLFDHPDQGGDIVRRGAYAASLQALAAAGQRVKLLWQHDPAQPIGLWEELREDSRGLWVRGRLLTATQKGREAAALVAAGAIDGLSIGYRTKRSERTAAGGRLLTEVELWEVSLVTFPMLPGAQVAAKAVPPAEETGWLHIAEILRDARLQRGGRAPGQRPPGGMDRENEAME
ncbi:HK97 family phage prohead protease [Pseudodonghicola flavimaris]|uniref:HK97 family phage prohead protease n=1 Tax=Pseudodonghicola flavimaris TaxID=3050036 RepID=A0ABT7F469_9RHOB|nr:HK97 family phage prohead protease [Pseudodonghicola flavimaris]MDK3019280.1 HK97 family phage prohead protease [Pseudodonghicola flavimaris]